MTKVQRIGSSRRAAIAESKNSKEASRRAATSIGRDASTRRLDSPIHAKKNPPQSEAGEQVAISTPNAPGYVNRVDAKKYEAMKEILVDAVPEKGGVTQGEMFDAVREKAPKSMFPGTTHRWWAKAVQLDLETKGVLLRIPGRPTKWRQYTP